jgi:predicted metal-dependent hydrolase
MLGSKNKHNLSCFCLGNLKILELFFNHILGSSICPDPILKKVPEGLHMKNRPSDLVIVNRRIEYNPLSILKENRIWNSEGIVMTHFLNAFQSLFPQGERVFIEAVRDCVAQNISSIEQDSILKDDLAHFIEQEGRHSVVHEKWTKALTETGYSSMPKYDMELHNFRTWARTHLDKMTRLSITIGAEQYTASLAKLFSKDRPDIVFQSTPELQKVFIYHAMEELEHKGVSYDLYLKLHGGYIRRIAGMAFITFYIWENVLRRHRYLLRRDGEWHHNRKREFWKMYLGKNGIISVLIPKIFEYMDPWFYPWQNDERRSFERIFGQLQTTFDIKGFQYKGKQLEENLQPE